MSGITFGLAQNVVEGARAANLWKGGPSSINPSGGSGKGDVVKWPDYLQALQAFEEQYTAATDGERVRRLRRIYYSSQRSYSIGRLFDIAIAGDRNEIPMTTGGALTQQLLDRLFYTDCVDVAGFGTLDVSHIWVALDVALNGTSAFVRDPDGYSGLPWLGLLSWTLDVATVFDQFMKERQKAVKQGGTQSIGADLRLVPAAEKTRSSVEDLIGDMDGEILAAQGGLTRESRLSLSSLLNNYFTATTTSADQILAGNRFLLFVANAKPPIPWNNERASPKLSADAVGTVRDYMVRGIQMIFTFSRDKPAFAWGELFTSRPDPVLELAQYPYIIDQFTKDFCQFLSDGLAGAPRPASWPSQHP